MLKFDRKSFKSGIQVVLEPEGEGVKRYVFKVSDKGKDFTFLDEDYVLEKYPALFTKVTE